MSAILLIDDHNVFAKIFSAYLLRTQYHNFSVENATSLHNATLHLKKQAFDLIVLDNRIPPHFDYLESIRLLIAENWAGPILLMSGEEISIKNTEPENLLISFFLLKDKLNEKTLDQAISHCLNNK